MKISRRGARANHGVSSIELGPIELFWEEDNKKFVSSRSVAAKDFSSASIHKYSIEIGEDEVLSIIDVIAKAAMRAPSEFGPRLEQKIKSLGQLQLIALGEPNRFPPDIKK